MGGYRIALADDHVLVRQGLRRLLGDVAGLKIVGEAGDGNELLSLLDAQAPEMVILDISMPNLRGIEALREIKKKCPAIKVLIVSMHKEYLDEALAAGADGYLLKEDADRELFAAIEKIRQGGNHVSLRLSGIPAGQRKPYDPLSVRENEILRLIAQGKSNGEAAALLFISVRTAEKHRASIMAKLKVRSTAELVRYAIEKGYL